MLQGFSEKRFGLIGGRLSHSFSPQIHACLADYDYRLFPMPASDIPAWFADCPLDGFNVTIPYKETVIPYLAALSDRARRIGSVNTVVRRPDGSFYGDNTDYFGFSYLVSTLGVSVKGKKALIFGSGGSEHTVRAVLEDLGASEVVTISRRGENNYENLDRHTDARILVNTTPVGMYPDTGVFPADPARFPGCEGALDLIYNPSKTAFLLRCEALGIPCTNGLPMLVAQAAEACRVFTGADFPDSRTPEIVREIEWETKNIVLIGMPGCGKTECGRALAEALGRPFRDTDDLILEAAGRTPAAIISEDGEPAFREIESRVLAGVCRESGLVIATGGGAVTISANRDILRQNGTVVFIDRDKSQLATEGRPLSARLDELYARRMPLYRAFSEITVPSRATVRETADAIRRACAPKGGSSMKLLIINGPNLNMLGIREPAVYGSRTFRDLEAFIRAACEREGVEGTLFQSNSEGDIVTEIQRAYGVYDGIVINPAAYTHTSVAILDALKAVSLPTVEVHLSDISTREAFRQFSYVSLYAERTIAGKGFDGYAEAIAYLASRLRS